MLRWYTCLTCGFPFMADDESPQDACPTCNAPAENIISEPLIPGQPRKIHVDPPKPDPNWDPMNAAYHCPKEFPADNLNGRARRFVLSYREPRKIKEFYENVFDWDVADTRVENPMHPLYYAATGAGTPNWEPLAPSFIYGFLRARRDDSTGKQPYFVVDTDDLDLTLDAVRRHGGKVLREPYRVGLADIADVEDTEGNAFYLWHTPEGEPWNYFNKDYIPPVIGRAPKKYPRRSLHGRVRGVSIPYDDPDRMRRFYIGVFGWDFYIMPPYFFGEGNTVYWAATGPTQATWEASVPGHVTVTVFPRSISDKPFLWMEVDSCRETVDATVSSGGALVSGRLDGKDWDESVGESGGDWSNMAIVDDPQGNRLLLWQCPGSRTWEEPEAAHDMDFERY